VLPPDEAALQKAKKPAISGRARRHRSQPELPREKMGAGGDQTRARLSLINARPGTELTRIFLEATPCPAGLSGLEDSKKWPSVCRYIIGSRLRAATARGYARVHWKTGSSGPVPKSRGASQHCRAGHLSGSLEVKDAEKASLNESVVLRYLQSMTSGVWFPLNPVDTAPR